jgi:hypothetical protein
MYKNEIIIKINVKIVKYVDLIKISNSNRRIICATTAKSNHHSLVSGFKVTINIQLI